MPARVLAVAQASELGGAEYALLRIARRLPDRGFEVRLAVPAEGGLAAAARSDGLAVSILPVGGLERRSWRQPLGAWPRARALLREVSPEIVYLNGAVTQRLVPALLGATFVLHLHDLVAARPVPWRSARFWRATPVVLCASDAVAASAQAAGAPRDRLRTVYCPVDPVEPAPRPAWAVGRPTVGYVGRIEPRKGALDLLRAAPAVLERHPDAQFVLVGEDEFSLAGDYVRQVRESAEALGGRAVMLGRVPHAARVMAWFDVLAVPSLEEPFGTVAAEALAAGTPVVATRSGGMIEYVVPGRNGELVPPGDPHQLARAIATLLARPGDMAEAAREDARRFDTQTVADAVADGLDEAVAAARRARRAAS